MMVRFTVAILLMMVSASSACAQVSSAARELAAAKALWLKKDYRGAYSALRLMRGKPYGRRVEVDFMLGTSACQIGYQTTGIGVLRNLMLRYPLRPVARKAVISQVRNCSANGSTIVLISAAMPTTSGGWGKTYHWLDSKFPVSSYPARRVREIDQALLTSRLTKRGKPLKKGFGASEQCTMTVGRFVIVCNTNNAINFENQRKITTEADAFVAFLHSQYDIVPADEYVTIRLVDSIPKLKRLAESLHGLDVSDATIAYSFQDDLSLVAVSMGRSGSVLHELTHLALRRDFGDAPQWLEEGLASLYEVSIFCEKGFFGLDNWRGDLLRLHWPETPKIVDMLKQNWFEQVSVDIGNGDDAPVTPSQGHERERASGEAKLRYLLFYLQEQEKLEALYVGLKDRPPEVDAASHQEAVLKRQLGAFYSDFELEDRVDFFAKRMKVGVPRQLSESCKNAGIAVRKDIPAYDSSVFEP